MPLSDTHISLAHGNGGRFMRELIEELFQRHLANPSLDVRADAVALPLEYDRASESLLFTTDGFTVQPLEFPGGDIGALAVHGTTNDLAVAGARPRYLGLNAFIEEGLEVALLDRVIGSLAAAAREIGVEVAAGDTKVLRRGEGGGLYLATTGIGIRPRGLGLGLDRILAGDRLVISGSIGDHGIAVMLAREQFGLSGDLESDAASVLPLTEAAATVDGLRFMRDPTRGGIASVCHEIRQATGLGVRLQQAAIPVRDPVISVCEQLGYDPCYLASEGRVLAVVSESSSTVLLERWRALDQGQDAAVIGSIEAAAGHSVVLETELGGQRLLDELEDDPLPRIC